MLAGTAGLLGFGNRAIAALMQDAPGVTPMKSFTAAEISKLRAAFGVPAMGAAHAHGGGKPMLIADGLRSTHAKSPVTADDLWHIGSNTKSMTSTLVARMVERGLLSWDTTIGELLGSAVPKMHESYKKANLRHLCSHHSGLGGDNLDVMVIKTYPEKEKDPRTARLRLAALGLEREPIGMPGEKFLYSNTGYVTVAAILESLTKQPWETLIAKEVFQPLGLKSAGFGPPGKAGRLDEPLGHEPGPDGSGLVPAILGDAAKPADLPAVLGPAGLVHMSTADLISYLNAHLMRPASFLKEESWTILHTPPFTSDYAMGWVLRLGGIWHNGSNGKWYGEMLVDHKRQRVACAMSNDGDLDKARPAIGELLRTAIETAV